MRELAGAVARPAAAKRDRGLARVLDHVHQHLTEPLDFRELARMAGFAPGHFSRLFRQGEGTSFEHYLLTLRIDRAKELLHDSALEVARIGELAGFHSPQYFSRAFKNATGMAPREYRLRPRKVR